MYRLKAAKSIRAIHCENTDPAAAATSSICSRTDSRPL
jgi:hypothetical protein